MAFHLNTPLRVRFLHRPYLLVGERPKVMGGRARHQLRRRVRGQGAAAWRSFGVYLRVEGGDSVRVWSPSPLRRIS